MYKPVALTGEKFHDPDDESDDHGWKNALWQTSSSSPFTSKYELYRAYAVPPEGIAKVHKHLATQEAPVWYANNVDYYMWST